MKFDREKIKEKANQVKAHVKRNQGIYTGIGVTGAFVVGCVVTKRYVTFNTPAAPTVVFSRPPSNLREVWVPKDFRRGNPVIRVNNVGNVGYFNQQQAARVHNIPPHTLSRHLNGELPDANGMIFRWLKDRGEFRIFEEM